MLDNRKVTPRRSVYLRHCVRISLRKRLPWLLALVAVTTPLLMVLKLPPGLIVLVLTFTGCLWTAYTALGSWRRHSQD